MNRQINLALIGAGNRGQGIFGQYALDMPHRCKFVSVVEPDDEKREFFGNAHNIPPESRHKDSNDFFARRQSSLDGVVIATLEDQRLDPVINSMKHGYNILVEKPLCVNKEDLMKLYEKTSGYKGIIIVCHQMRLAPAYATIKELLDSKRYGDLITIQHSENLSYSHMAHSFVRGVFNNSCLTPMLLAKSCHDMDILTYWTGKKAERVSSFGSLKYFRKENCPEGAPLYCLDGCKHYRPCPYHALKLYFEEDTDPAYLRQMGVAKDKESLRKLLLKNRYGKCVFQTDNNVVDHQTVQIQFEDDILVSFTMCGHNGVERRISKFSLTNGEIEYDTSKKLITAYSFEPRRKEIYEVKENGTHGGGDRAIMNNYVDAIENNDSSILLTPIRDSVEGHLLVFAAEESRKTGKVINVRAFEK